MVVNLYSKKNDVIFFYCVIYDVVVVVKGGWVVMFFVSEVKQIFGNLFNQGNFQGI